MCFLHFVHFYGRQQRKVPKKAKNKIIFKVRGEKAARITNTSTSSTCCSPGALITRNRPLNLSDFLL